MLHLLQLTFAFSVFTQKNLTSPTKIADAGIYSYLFAEN